MSDDVVAWLRAQLDNDEVIARRASTIVPAPWRHVEARSVIIDAHTRDIAKVGYVEAQHMERHDPIRVLVEVEAKRRTLDHLAININGEPLVLVCDVACECPGGSDTCRLVRLLALPYADQPGYREEWRP
jgi:hypothetical protein